MGIQNCEKCGGPAPGGCYYKGKYCCYYCCNAEYWVDEKQECSYCRGTGIVCGMGLAFNKHVCQHCGGKGYSVKKVWNYDRK